MSNLLNKDINIALIKTIVFFDLFNYPLTTYELWRYLSISSSYLKIHKFLDNLKKEGKISEKQGFYFLPNREELINYRQKRYHFANRKINKAKRVAKLFSYIPWLRFVALSNLIGRHNMRDGSDIDLFIICQPNRLWLTRFFCAGLMKVLNKRPTKGNKRDKICLSFYVDEDHLNLENLTLKEGDDYYFYYWLAGFYSLYDKGSYHSHLINNNNWLKKYLPNSDFVLSNQAYSSALFFKSPSNLNCKLSKLFFSKLDKLAEIFQKKIMPTELKKLANLDSRVVISQGVLKLYLRDRRLEFKERFFKKISKYI